MTFRMSQISTTRSAFLRIYIAESLLRFGANPSMQTSETLLIRDGSYCGQRFRRGDYQAVWFVDEDQVKFYGPNGEVLDVVHPSEVSGESRKMAA